MPLNRVEHCPVCSGTSFQPFLVCKDYTQSGELFHVEQCTTCQLLLTNPRPSEFNSARYYQSEDYISHKTQSKGLINSIYLIIRQFTLKWKYRLVQPYLTSNSILDIGCGTGAFLNVCKKHGAAAFGIEPAEEPRRQATSQDIQVVETLAQLPQINYDVITMWHVLEHLYNLQEDLAVIAQKLSKGGTLFIAVPNWQSADAKHYKENWAAYDVPRHLWHFSKTNMTQLLKHSGLTVQRIIPMKLDAYYVSMLSEKNINKGRMGLAGLMKALIVAFRSNSSARREMNYSSLIYVARK